MKKIGLAAVITTAALLLSSCGSAEVALQVGDKTVTTADLSIFLSSAAGSGQFEESKDQFVEQVEDMLKYEALAPALGVELSDEDMQQVVQMKASYAQQAGGLKAYKEYLESIGTSIDALENILTASVYQSEVYSKLSEDIEEPTDDEIKTYFKDNYYRAKHILISTEGDISEDEAQTKANDLLAQAENGADFDTLIAENSDDPGSESNPDGYIFTDGDMVPEFEECVKSLGEGEFNVCKSTYGYHVIQRLPFSENEEKFNEWLEDNKTSVSSAIKQKKIEEKVDSLLAENNITVTVNEDVLAAYTEDKLPDPAPTAEAQS